MSTRSLTKIGLAIALAGAPITLAGSAGATQSASVTTHDRAGYAVTADQTSRVSARWVEPTATCGRDDSYASFRVALRSGPHVVWIGTAVDCHGGTPSYYAWEGSENRSSRIRGGRVMPGDVVGASLAAHGRKTMESFEDDTQGWGVAGGGVGGPKMRYITATVGVVARTGAHGLLPLTNFDSTSFSSVKVNGAPIDGQHPTRLVMKSGDGVLQAVPGPLRRDSSFDVRWKHA